MRTLFAAFLFWVSPVHANDSFASLQGGDLILEKTTQVSMEKEVLYVSREKVRVDYEFKNLTRKDITTLISFPLVTVNSEAPTTARIEEWVKGGDPLHFSANVDGKPVAVKPTWKKKILQAEGPEIFDLEVQYVWTQTFPAGKTIRVSHEYTPSLGTGGNEEMGWKKEQYCANAAYGKKFQGLIDLVKKRLESGEAKGSFKEEKNVRTYLHFNSFSHFAYVVTTAKNWAGPIKSFELVVDKGTPETLTATCWKGLKPISATQLKMTRRNFVPATELKILFADPA